MESTILMLDDRTDQATKQMLQNVVKRKKKYDDFKSKHLLVMSTTLFLVAIYFIYLYFTVAKPYSYSFATMFSAFVGSSVNFYWLIAIMGSFGYMNLLREKRDKAEKEFHALRCEIIDKSKDLWKKEEAWSQRHQVYEMMKSNYDINLYHENK
jgi:hypothetical protein